MRKRFVRRYYPRWFAQILKEQSPFTAVGEYSLRLQSPVNGKEAYTFHRCFSLGMQQMALDMNIGLSATTHYTSNFQKTYIYDCIRNHQWRNSMNSEADLEFYKLQPRYDIPHKVGVNNDTIEQIAPALSYNFTGGAALHQVTGTMWQQSLADVPSGLDSIAKIPYQDPAATPYMSYALTQMFKISRFPVIGPNGRKTSHIRLQPGETCKVSCQSRVKNPKLVSYARFGLSSQNTGGTTIGFNYEVMKDTPLIFLQLKGTPSSGTGAQNTITCLGPAQVDYYSDYKIKCINVSTDVYNTYRVTVGDGAPTAQEQIEIVDAAEATELDL